jgi:hypothetical protein
MMPIQPVLLSVVLLLASGSEAQIGQPLTWRDLQHQRLVKFDYNCTSRSAYPAAKLNRIVRRVMKREDFEGIGTSADRAFAFDLNGDGRSEYFVPLDCGAVGNCMWGVFALNPARELGLIAGQYIFVHRSAGRWPDLASYAHLSAIEGSVTTYHFHGKRYAALGSPYPINHGEFALQIQGGMGHKLPDFVNKAKPACKSLGY